MEGFKQSFVDGSWRNEKAFHQIFAPSPPSGSRNGGALAGGKSLECPHHVRAQSGGQSQQIPGRGTSVDPSVFSTAGTDLVLRGDLV